MKLCWKFDRQQSCTRKALRKTVLRNHIFILLAEHNMLDNNDANILVLLLTQHVRHNNDANILVVRLNFINHLVGFIPCQICLYFSN